MIDGVVKLVDPEENSNRPKPRYVFFFEKVLMVCKQRVRFTSALIRDGVDSPRTVHRTVLTISVP